MTIKVPQTVLDGLEFVRKSGKTNMFDVGAVQKIAFDNEYYATVDWLQDNKKEYSKGVFQGFEAIEE